jgi:hypothetical protein
MRIPIYSMDCGHQIAWWHGPSWYGWLHESQYYERLDGSRPKSGEHFHEVCPTCGKDIDQFNKVTFKDENF